MSLEPGTRLGPYEIVSRIGAGGMGEVYRADDTRLGRTVAIKVLPAELSADPQRRQRFEREARTISNLTHPNICTLYDIGREGETDYLVMELIEGETLGERLSRGSLSAQETVDTSIQIASALDAAHRHGVVHRDLKPGNIMLARSGVKLLDFGLAKLAQHTPGSGSLSLTALPTEEIADTPLTAEGAILGTFQYMAPEQLEGAEVDARTDIFSFGVIMYEAATGRRPFQGKSQASLIAAILREVPRPISQLQPVSPPALDRLVNVCLAKDPEERIQSAHDVKLQLEWIAEGGSPEAAPEGASPATTGGRGWFWPLAATVLFVTVIVMALTVMRTAPEPRLGYLDLALPRTEEVAMFTYPAISPDGSRLVTVAEKTDGGTLLWIRSMESGEGRFLTGTEGAALPFWSPDGRYIGFFADRSLKKVMASGGPSQVLTRVDGPATGATWGADDVILFSGSTEGVFQVTESGGDATLATEREPVEEGHFWPSFFPDGRHFVFLGDARQAENHYLRIGEIGSTESPRLVNVISNFVVVPPDIVLYCRSGSLLAQRIDIEGKSLAGEPVVLADDVIGVDSHYNEFTANETMLAYRKASPLAQMKWVDRTGRELEALGKPARIWDATLSPDETRIAYQTFDTEGRAEDIWILDLARDAATRFTTDPGADRDQVWIGEGDVLAFSSSRAGQWNFYSKPTATNAGIRLVSEDFVGSILAASPDGRYLLIGFFDVATERKETNLWAIPLAAGDEPIPLVGHDVPPETGVFSPDGRWIAYSANKTDRGEIYVQSFPDPHTSLQISTEGGYMPRWPGDGSELYFMRFDGAIAVVEVTFGERIAVSAPQDLFRLPNSIRSFDVAADGQRLLVVENVDDPNTSPLRVILNWKRLLEPREN